MNKERIIKEFALHRFGSKGWLQGDLHCPECGRSDKFATLFTENGAVCHCFRCSLKTPLFKVLKEIGRSDLIVFDKQYTPKSELPELHSEEKIEPVVVDKIFMYQPLYFDPYLNDRGFTKEQYKQLYAGESHLDVRVKGKIVFLIYQHNNLVAWLARSRKTKEWHKENLRKSKLGLCQLELRYRNSNSDFSKILGALDEITPNTRVVILVEGIMDKANIDRVMGLTNDDYMKCCFTFGSDISSEQAQLIPDSVTDIILMYDPDALRNMKDSGGRLVSRFNVSCAIIEDKTVDPGNITPNYLARVLGSTKNYIEFYNTLIGELN